MEEKRLGRWLDRQPAFSASQSLERTTAATWSSQATCWHSSHRKPAQLSGGSRAGYLRTSTLAWTQVDLMTDQRNGRSRPHSGKYIYIYILLALSHFTVLERGRSPSCNLLGTCRATVDWCRVSCQADTQDRILIRSAMVFLPVAA